MAKVYRFPFSKAGKDADDRDLETRRAGGPSKPHGKLSLSDDGRRYGPDPVGVTKRTAHVPEVGDLTELEASLAAQEGEELRVPMTSFGGFIAGFDVLKPLGGFTPGFARAVASELCKRYSQWGEEMAKAGVTQPERPVYLADSNNVVVIKPKQFAVYRAAFDKAQLKSKGK